MLTEFFFASGESLSEYVRQFRQRPEYFSLAPNSLLLLTDGFCASTCSIFVRTIRGEFNNTAGSEGDDTERVRLVGYGGLTGRRLRGSTVPANVLSQSLLVLVWDVLESWGYQDPERRPNLLPYLQMCQGTSAVPLFQVAYREAYTEAMTNGSGPANTVHANARPIEFTPNPVDVMLEVWPDSSNEATYGRWQLAANQFHGMQLPLRYTTYYGYSTYLGNDDNNVQVSSSNSFFNANGAASSMRMEKSLSALGLSCLLFFLMDWMVHFF
jgi:hypothetical protein